MGGSRTLIWTSGIYSEIFYWHIIEVHVGVLSACLPTLRPVQERLASSFSFTHLRDLVEKLLPLYTRTHEVSRVRLDSMEERLNWKVDSETAARASEPGSGLRY